MATTRAYIQWRRLGAILALACIVAPLFSVLTSSATLGSAVQGLVDGILIAFLVGGYLLFVRDGWLRASFRRLSFVQDLALSSAVVLVLFLVGRAAGQMATHRDPARFLISFTDSHLLVALPFFAAIAVTVQFILQINRMIGVNSLGYFLAGVYHRPKAEERIFLFVDLVGSTSLAERLGSARYFELLRHFVDDLTGPVLETEGEIYQYAGDEVVITWPIKAGLRDANSVRCFFGMRDAIARCAKRYERAFGAVPRFRGGLHGGTVTAGELGDTRQQIVFVGDILNTAARLQEYAKRSGLDLVVSDALLQQFVLPPGVEAAYCGELELKGKESRVIAYSLSTERG